MIGKERQAIQMQDSKRFQHAITLSSYVIVKRLISKSKCFAFGWVLIGGEGAYMMGGSLQRW